jgi:membrane protease YdiL (CAAX protease family)
MIQEWIRKRTIFAYVLLAYGITWLIAIPLVLSYNGWISLQIPLALHYILPFGPLLAALIVSRIAGGSMGLREILKRMSKWRVGLIWLAIAIFSVWGLYLLSSTLLLLVGQPWPDIGIFGQVMYLPYLTIVGSWFLWVFTFGIGEETGWRGFLLPNLQSKYNALTSAIIVSIIWAGWHIPMFLYNENLRAMGVFGTIFWVVGLMFGSVLLTWLYNSTKGSILMTAIWHGTFNLFTAAAGQAAATTSAMISMFVMVLVVLIVIVYRPKNLSSNERQKTEGT